MSRVFEAKYPGRCGECDRSISEGDDVTFEDDELIHAKCEGLHSVPETVCATCWLVHAGECDR